MRHTTGSVYAIFDQPVRMYRGTTMAGIITDEAGQRSRAAASSAATSSRRSRSACRSWRRSSIPARGGGTSPRRWRATPTSPGCGSSARTCRRSRTASRCTPSEKDPFGLPIPNVHFDDHANDVAMRNHAFKQGRAVYEAVGARRVHETPPYPSTHNLGTCRQSARAAGRGLQQVRPDPRHREPVHLGRQPVHHRRGREPDADDRDAGDPPGRLHRRPDGQERDLSGQGPPPTSSPGSGPGVPFLAAWGAARPTPACVALAIVVCSADNKLGNYPGAMDDPHPERNFGFLVHDVARLMRVAYDRRARALGLTRSQWWVLNNLYFNQGITQSDARRPARHREADARPAARPARGQGLGRAARRSRRPAGQADLSDRRGQGSDARAAPRSRPGCAPAALDGLGEVERRQLLDSAAADQGQPVAPERPTAAGRAPERSGRRGRR